MKKLLVAIILLFVVSCDLEYDGAERIEFRGKVVDENENPLSNVYVIAAAEKDNWHDYDEISYDYTDENGNFSMFFPSPTNEDDLQLLVNYANSIDFDILNRSRIRYYNILDGNLNQYRLDFGDIELFDFDETAVTLEILLHSSGQYEFLGWNLDGQVVDNEINLSPLVYKEDNYFYSPNQVLVNPNQTIEMTYYYRTNSGTEIMHTTVHIEVENQNLTYEIVL